MSEQLWWVRLPTGEEFGPIATSSLTRLIEKGIVTADDEVSNESKKDFKRLRESHFFPILTKLPKFVGAPPSKDEITEALDESIVRTHTDEKFGSVKVSVLKNQKRQNRASQEYEKLAHTHGTNKSDNTIELSPHETLLNFISNKKNRDILLKAVLGFAVVGSLLFLILPDQENSGEEGIHLVSPKENSRQLSETQIEEILQKSKSAFETDSFGGYLFAMNELVTAAESVSRNTESLSLLCMTYFELWPYTYKDSEDLAAVTKLTQMATKADPVGPQGGICRVILQFLSGKTSEADALTDSLLTENAGVPQLYSLKAQIFEVQKNYAMAAAYAQKTEQLWPAWARPYVKESFYQYRNGQAPEAATRLRDFIKSWPKHVTAKVLLGTIEYVAFKHVDLAIELIKPALSSGEKIENTVRAEAAFALASAYSDRQDKDSALTWGKKAYLWDSSIAGLKEFLTGLGGEKIFEALSGSDRENLSMGDQYFASGNYLSAQEHYKAAFKANPKNSTAAFKAGQTLWKLNQGMEAIEWFKKAIATQPEKVEPYVALADIYSSRYEFFAAAAILEKAQKQAPRHYDVYRGYATLAYTRNDFAGAITSAKKALSLYDTDMQSMLLLVKSYLGSNQPREAYTYAARAIELEKTNPEAQALYGETLAEAQGTDAALSYLQNLVNTYPKIPDYGVALSRLYFKEGRSEQALNGIGEVLSVSPKNKSALLLQGDILSKNKNIDDSLASYLAAAALDPSDVQPVYMVGQLYLHANQPVPAIAQFERVLAVNPNFPKVHLAIGQAALLMGNRDRALKEVADEKRLNPGLADPYLLAGDIQMDLKQYGQAANEYQAALKLRPQGAEVYLRLAKSYRLSNQYDVAISMLRTAETRESGNAEIAKEFGAVYELKGDTMGAVKFYNRYLQILPNAPDRSAIVDRINHLGGSIE